MAGAIFLGSLMRSTFGFAAGMLGNAYNINGVPIVLYASMRDWSPKKFHGTVVQPHFILSSTFIINSHFLSGFWTAEVGVYYLASIPAVIGAILQHLQRLR